YYCFGCHESGDALRFLMNYDHLTFPEAVEALAAFNGVEVIYEESFDAHDNAQTKARVEEGLACLEAAANFFHEQFYLPIGEKARNYLRQRKVKKTIVDQFLLGYAPAEQTLIKALGDKFSIELMKAVGLIGEKDGRQFDWFRDRLMFPIRNIRGQVIAFGARALGDVQPKYLNSAESDWFNKRYELYGLDQALQSKPKSLIVTEGYMDVVKLTQYGFPQSVAALGTAIGETHIQQLKKRTKKAYFCFDGDTAGQDAAKKALQAIFAQHDDSHEWRFVFMPEGEDPDSLLTKEGRESFHQYLDASLTPSQFIQRILAIQNREQWSVEQRAKVVHQAEEWLAYLPEGSYRELLQQELQNLLSASLIIEAEPSKTQNEQAYSQKYISENKQSVALARAEWRMTAILEKYPQWSLCSEISDAIPMLQEKYPFFIELLYLARAGATSDLLNQKLLEKGIEKEIEQSRRLLSVLSEVELKQEFLGTIARLQAQSANLRERLEKLGERPH
ncbi:DNA primase, partial [Suttonella ornithocola]